MTDNQDVSANEIPDSGDIVKLTYIENSDSTCPTYELDVRVSYVLGGGVQGNVLAIRLNGSSKFTGYGYKLGDSISFSVNDISEITKK